MQLKIGADPEVWLTKSNEIISCVGLIGGTKAAPKPVKDSKIGLKVQEDGVAVEFNFDPVAPEAFPNTIAIAKKELHTYIQQTVGKEYSYVCSATAVFKDDQLVVPQAVTFGCDQDNLAYQRGEIRPPLTAKELGNIRCAGGHIHFGYDKEKCQVPEWALIQGIEALGYLRFMRKVGDRQFDRRKYYGLPGLYRSKEYGVEYRTPSNYWLNQATFVTWITSVAEQIINKPAAFQDIYQRIDWDAVQKAISSEYVPDTLAAEVLNFTDTLHHAPKEE